MARPAADVPRDVPTEPRKPIWLIPNLLSLDAPLVAVTWLYMFAKTWRVFYLSWFYYVSLALVVWVIYATDRLLDASLRGGQSETLEARHLFHRKHRRVFRWVAVSVGLAAVVLIILTFPAKVYELGIVGAVMVGAFFVLAASGALDVWRTVSRQHYYRVFDPDAVKTGERLRLATPTDSLFLNAPTYNSAVVLSGRLSLIRYPGHLGSHGIDYGERERDVKQIYRGGPEAVTLLDKYGIDYVLISPEERNTLTPNEGFFARFPMVADFGQYKVYDVRDRTRTF